MGVSMPEWLNLELILALAFGISETLSLIPGISSNSIFQLIYNMIKKLAGKS